MKKVLLIDGNNILHRAYHGLPLLKTADGRYTNAVYGFLKMLNKIEEQESPDYVAVCFDKGKNTFRHRLYPEYKAQRKPTDPELAEQFPLIREVLALNGYLCLESDEYEADDLMGTLAVKAAAEAMEAVIFSGDKDLLQVLNNNITVVSGKKQLTDLVKNDESTFREKYGIEPYCLIDLKGLMGDSSDNYPGVAGVGEKTALKLLTEYGSLENLYAHIEELPKNKLYEKLVKDKEMAQLSYKLATIVTDVPLDLTWEALIPKAKYRNELLRLYRDLEFRGFLKDLETQQPQDLFSDNLFDMAENVRPFEIVKQDNLDFLKETDAVSVVFTGETVTLANREKSWISFSAAEQEEFLKQILEAESVKKYTADIKGLWHFCLERDIKLRNVPYAAELMAYLDNCSMTSYLPGQLAEKYLKYDTYLFEEDKTAAEACLLFDICDVLKQRLAENGAEKLYADVELPLAEVLANMEHTGIFVRRDTLKAMSEELEVRLDMLVKEIYNLCGEEFNLNSPKQLSVVLFEKLNLPKGKKTKTGYSTNSDVLEGLKGTHPVIGKILEYRTVAKLKSTYTDALGGLISAETGRIHTKFLQTVTTTGRLSSADPNLQNIPVRVEEGRKIRKAFEASDDEHILLAADYSQIELRLLAHFADDPVLIDSFIKEEDIHARTAGEIFGVPTEEVTKDMRRAAKAVNFGIIYGISSYSLGNDIGVSRKTAQEYIDGYFGRYPKIKAYLDGVVADAKAKGYAETLMGRRRELPELKNSNYNIRSFGERTAMNTPLQGSAADIIKLVMVKLFAELKAKGLESKMILQVHDELMLDCKISELPVVIPLLKSVMEQTVQLRVPLTVDMKQGNDWYNMEKIGE